MKQPVPMMQASYEMPHCPTCHCAWFRTLNLSGPLSQWTRQCKNCGTEYSTDESLMLLSVMTGEANYVVTMKHMVSGTLHTYEGVTMEDAANKALERLATHEVIQMPKERQKPVVTVVRR